MMRHLSVLFRKLIDCVHDINAEKLFKLAGAYRKEENKFMKSPRLPESLSMIDLVSRNPAIGISPAIKLIAIC